jgi:hypothetical protein
MTTKITFIARDEFGANTQTRPYPASEKLPPWYKEYPPYERSEDNPEGKKLMVIDGVSNATYRKCVPMLDALTTGYLIDLFGDVLVRRDGDHVSLTWRTMKDIIDLHVPFQKHGTNSEFVSPPPGYSNLVFKYLNTWIPRTPPGYSCLITEPFGYRDTPFKAIPAVIDTDKSSIDLSFPMWLKTGFEGVIEKGTPMVQIFPFKREDWKAEYSFYKDNQFDEIQEKNFNGTIINHYIKNHWTKKRYR